MQRCSDAGATIAGASSRCLSSEVQRSMCRGVDSGVQVKSNMCWGAGETKEMLEHSKRK